MTHRPIAVVALLLGLSTPGFAQAPPTPPDVAAAPADAAKTASGLASKVLQPGKEDRKATADDLVSVNFSVWTADGKLQDSTLTKGRPARFALANVIPGWRECVTLMSVGEHRRCWIPQELTYKGAKGRPAGTLVFDIELVSAEPSPATPPPDVAKVPSDASRLPSGLAYRVLTPGV
ncbi:MAG: FKBP-type peptidyl-prolyl cis-trans isomerase, partial [Vicinamibacterales bacterium]